MTIGDRMRFRRRELHYTLDEVAQKINVSKQTIQRYETGVIGNIPSDKIENIAKVLDTTPAYLMGWEEKSPLFDIPNIYPIKTKKFPLLGSIACGEPKYANEDRESYIEASTDIRADFCLKATGDSMINARINEGDIVFIREQPMVENGEIAAVIVNSDEATLKRVFYYPDKGLLILRAENPTYEDLIYSKNELNEVRVLGKAIAFQSDVK